MDATHFWQVHTDLHNFQFNKNVVPPRSQTPSHMFALFDACTYGWIIAFEENLKISGAPTVPMFLQ